MLGYKKLPAFRRGSTLDIPFKIKSAHTPANFTGGVFCTIRDSIPASTVVDDSGALAKVSTTATAAGRITFVETSPNVWEGNVRFEAAETYDFPLQDVYVDICGVIGTGATREVPEVPMGSWILPVFGDLRREV